MYKKLKSTKGLTLIELIVGMLMFAIIVTTVTMMMAPTMNLFSRTTDLAERNALLDNIANMIINDMETATRELQTESINNYTEFAAIDADTYMTIWAMGNAAPVGLRTAQPVISSDDNEIIIIHNLNNRVVYSINNNENVLLRDGRQVLSQDYHRNMSVSYTLERRPGEGAAYNLTLTLSSMVEGRENDTVQRVYAVKPLAIAANQFLPPPVLVVDCGGASCGVLTCISCNPSTIDCAGAGGGCGLLICLWCNTSVDCGGNSCGDPRCTSFTCTF